MIPSWLRPNKIGIVFCVPAFVSVLLIYGLSTMFQSNHWSLHLIVIVLLSAAYTISMLIGRKVRNRKWGLLLLGWIGLSFLSLYLMWLLLFTSLFDIGLPFGYYGEYNRVKYRLRSIPGIKIVGRCRHRDSYLEDFDFVVQTQGGLLAMLDFYDFNATYELFKQADGLVVQSKHAGKGLVYKFGSSEKLEQAMGQEIRNATDVMKCFDKIAEFIETDRSSGTEEEDMTTRGKNFLWITYPTWDLTYEAIEL